MLKANQNQKLSTHLIRVAILSKKIIEKIKIKENSDLNIKKIANLAYFSGLCHDLGKVDPVFQKYLMDKSTTKFNPNGVHIEKKGFSFDNHPRHNEISWFIIEELFDILFDKNKLNKIEKRILKNVVLWHHASPIRKDEFTTSNIKSSLKKEFKEFKENIIELLSEFKDEIPNFVCEEIDETDLDSILFSEERNFLNYKQFITENADKDLEQFQNDIRYESITSLIRSVVITADRHVSINGKDFNKEKILNEIFEENKYSELIYSIEKMEKKFNKDIKRNKNQEESAKKLGVISKNGEIAILNAPAGSGKTKIALQWLKETKANKVYYIVPRTIIAEEIFYELKTKYLKKNVSFEIITGELQNKWNGNKEYKIDSSLDFFKSDIVITTIDQLIKSTTTHKNISLLQDIINSSVIFDEYHEYYKMSGLDILFAEIIKIKSFLEDTKTLIMSATPNYFMLDNFLNICDDSYDNMVYFKSVNNKDFKINYITYQEGISIKESHPLLKEEGEFDYKINSLFLGKDLDESPFYKLWNDKKTIVISNTATTAQKSFIINNKKENCILAHSKFKDEDKVNMLKNIKEKFSKIDNEISTLRSGPIVQASLNITSERLLTDLTSPENTLQRLGRLNRFGDDFTGEFIIAVPLNVIEKDIKTKSNVLTILNKSNDKESSIYWIDFLMSKIKNKENFKLEKIYSIYKEFYLKEETKNILQKELEKSLIKSYKNVRKNILNPIEIIGKKDTKKDEKIFSKRSLRGNNYNAKMTIYELSDDYLILKDDYIDNIGLSRELILMHDENYEFIKETVKKMDILNYDIPLNIKSLLNKAKKQKSEKYYRYVLDQSRNSNFNIYTSFSKKDLDKINKKRNNDHSFVYLKTKKQVIGYLKLKNLIK